MGYLILGFSFLLFIVAYKNLNQKKIPKTEFIFHFKKNKDIILKQNESVNLWSKPDSNSINIYAKGYYGGEGLIGSINNKKIKNHLIKNKKYISKILNTTEHLVQIHIKLI